MVWLVFCKSCDICQRTIQKVHVTKFPFGRLPLIKIPFKRVAIDKTGPIDSRSDRKFRYILTMKGNASRDPEAVTIRNV